MEEKIKDAIQRIEAAEKEIEENMTDFSFAGKMLALMRLGQIKDALADEE